MFGMAFLLSCVLLFITCEAGGDVDIAEFEALKTFYDNTDGVEWNWESEQFLKKNRMVSIQLI